MPNITEYNAGSLQLNPTEIGIDATAQAARRINSVYNEVAEAKGRTLDQFGRNLGSSIRDAGDAAVDYEDHRQISLGAASLAQKTMDLTEVWNKAVKSADPNDPNVANKFLLGEGGLEDQLTEFKKGFTTEKSQAWAEQRLDALRNHFSEKTTADMGVLANDAVRVNSRQLVNSASNTARTDPSSIEFMIDTVKSSIGDLVDSAPNLKGAAAASAKTTFQEQAIESIVKAGAMGAIEQAPDPDAAARSLAAKFPKYINGAELQTLVSAARAQVRMRRLEDQSATNQQHTQNIRAANDAANTNFTKNVDIGDDGSISIKPGFFKGARDIAQLPDSPHGLAEGQINWGQANLRRGDVPVKTDPIVHSQLTEKMFDPDHPTTELDLMRANGIDRTLSDKDFTRDLRLVKELNNLPKDPVFNASMAAMKKQLEVNISGLSGSHPEGAARYSAAILQYHDAYTKAKRDGTLKPNDTDANDPTSMVSRIIKANDVSASQKLSEYMAAVRSLAAPKDQVKIGETRDTAGVKYKFLGGNPALEQSWQVVK